MELEIVHRIRGEVKFEGPEALSAQIRKDIDQVREVLL